MPISPLLVLLVGAGAAAPVPPTDLDMLVATRPGARLLPADDGSPLRVFGTTFATGATPERSARRFADELATSLGVATDDLAERAPFGDGRHAQDLVFDPRTGRPRFTAVSYTQTWHGLDVHGSRLTVLVRNEPGHPAVLAAPQLHALRGVTNWNGGRLAPPDAAIAAQAAREHVHADAVLDGPVRWVIMPQADGTGRLAFELVAAVGTPWDGDAHARRRLVVDATNGALLHDEDLVQQCLPDGALLAGALVASPAPAGLALSGTVRGFATEGSAADECGPESAVGLPYAQLDTTLGTIYADETGAYAAAGVGEVSVTSMVRGRWFRVFNQEAANATLTETVTLPAVADFLHNAANDDDAPRAEVNAYLEANRVRDFVLAINPAYPVIGAQTSFAVNVNINDSCNAFYNGSSINFYRRAGVCNNTAFSVVVHHEYGHHLVSVGGSGQGAYGEGMGDVMGVLVTDDPQLGRGFYVGNCATGIRDADNTCQLTSQCSSCGSEIHACGQLISGAVRSVFQELREILPTDAAHDTIAALAVNSILLHSGTSIGNDIPIDYLVLDDDDADLGNGTPHYAQIANGFLAHGFDVPEVLALTIAYPDGRPDLVAPSGGTTLVVQIGEVAEQLADGSARLHVDAGAGDVEIPLADEGGGTFVGAFPAIPCGTALTWYVSAATTQGTVVTSPSDAPSVVFSATSAVAVDVAFTDDCETDPGWTVSGNATSGVWERGVPPSNTSVQRPDSDGDGSGQCWVTELANGGGTDIDGTTILTSPAIDASEAGTVSFWYWLAERPQNPAGPEDGMRLEVATDAAGTNWTTVRTYATYEPVWRTDAFAVGDGGDVPTTATLRLRFTAYDLPPDNVVEAAVDGVTLASVVCAVACASDVNGSGDVGFDDLLAVLAAWGPCTGCPEDLDANGTVDFTDLLEILAAWGPCTGG